MSEKAKNRGEAIPLWRALALLTRSTWTEAAYGFGVSGVAEAVGTPDEIGAELARFLGGLERESVEAERLRIGHFSVEVEVEPHGGPGTLAGPAGDFPAERPVPLWEASARVGDGRGVSDACYSFGNSQGDEGHLLGTAHELGAELARVLQGLSRADVEAMKYGTDRFFIHLLVELPRER